jgi:two-component system chemotaxis response regulator CheB
MSPKTRVLVVDDSALMRQLLPEILGQDPSIEIVGTASDPYTAWDKIKDLQPDVLTLDVEMPRMDGLTFLGKIMQLRPMPIVMVSSLTERGCETTMRALELGAVDFVTKPKIDVTSGTVALGDELVEKVKAAATARVRTPVRTTTRNYVPTIYRDPMLQRTNQVIAIGASTGGTEALYTILTSLPADSPGIVAVIHMPERFTTSFAKRLDRDCQIRVSEAKDGDRILAGHALIAPGNFHMRVVRQGSFYSVVVENGVPVNRHRPSVDVLFESCARYLGRSAVGVILTGMGNDGATGLLAMRKAGARCLAQDEATCVVFGMPREAIALDAADEILPLDRIADRVIALSQTSTILALCERTPSVH